MTRARLPLAAALAALVALSPRARAAEPADDQFTRTGTFKALISDEFAAGRSKHLYELETDAGEVLSLTFDAPPAARTGDRVSVTGWPGRHGFEVGEINPLPRGPHALSAWTTGAKRVLVILVNFTDDSSFNSTTVSSVQNLYFGASGSVAGYYSEASYGQVSMTGDVVLVTATVVKPPDCNTGTIQTQGNAQAKASGYDPANYNFPVWIFPTIGACGWSGLGYVGGGGSWINGAPSGSWGLLVAGHELGHNFGVYHAHSLQCPSAAIAPSGCSRSEYGDRFDIMGNSRPGHFSAPFKDTFNWLPAGSVKVHTGGSATYTLGALEAGGQAVYAVKIPTTATSPARTYWVEWRSRAGFDAGEPSNVSNGGLVRIAPSSYGDSDLLDMNWATAGNFDDAELDVPNVFTDPEVGLTVTALSKTGSSLTVKIDYGAPPPPTAFHTLTPCRVFDTRNANGTYGGPALAAGQTRTWVIRGQCGVPATAKSVAGNLTVTAPTAPGMVRVAPGGAPPTGTSSLNFRTGQTRANAVTTGLGANGDILVDGLPAGTAHLVFDVVGWFE